MKTLLIALLLVACGAPARADEAAVAANQLLAAQIADAVTTRAAFRLPGFYERDPLARPFVHNDLSMAASVIVINLVVRRLFHPVVLRLLTGADAVSVANNFRVLSR